MALNFRYKQWLAGIGLLLCGFIVGVLTSPFVMRNFFHEPGFFPPPPPHEIRERIVERMADELDLTEVQINQIRPLIDRATNEVERLRQTVEPQIHSTLDLAMEEMNQFLTPEQQKIHAALRKKFEEHHREVQKRRAQDHNNQ